MLHTKLCVSYVKQMMPELLIVLISGILLTIQECSIELRYLLIFRFFAGFMLTNDVSALSLEVTESLPDNNYGARVERFVSRHIVHTYLHISRPQSQPTDNS